jgi:sugar (pentulose or hexulose) kinase
MLLTGQCVSDNNIAALSGLFSLKENNYWQPALDVLKIDRNNLPDIIEIGNVAGKTQRDNPLGISKNIPVFSCGNDQTAGAFGAGLQASDVLITLGTAQTVYRCCEKMPTPNVQFRGYYPGGLYYSMCAGPGGDLITKAIEKVPELKDFNTFAKFAANADATIAPVFYVKSETNEVFWSNDRAGLAEKALAVLDFLADEIFDFFVKLNGSPKNIKTIYVAGGGQNIPTWVNAIEKKLSHKIKCISYSPIHGTALMMNKDR